MLHLPTLLLLLACSDRSPPADPPQRETSAREDQAPDDPLAPAPREVPLDPGPELGATLGEDVLLRASDLRVLAKGARIDIPWMVARLRPAGDFVDLDEPRSFEVHVERMRVEIDEQSTSDTFQKLEGALKELEVQTEGSSFQVEGKLKTLGIPFEAQADPRADAQGRLVLDMEKAKVLGIGVKPLLGAIEKALTKEEGLLEVEDGTLYIDPFPFDGPPVIHAHFDSASVQDGRIVAILGEDARPEGVPVGLTLSGGVVRTGPSVLFDAILGVRPQEEGPLVIDAARFDEQMAEGFTKQGEGRRITAYVVPPGDLDAVAGANDTEGADEEER